MSAFQFETSLNPDHTLSVPPDVAVQLDPTAPVRVVLFTCDVQDEADWQQLAMEQFFEGYGPGDEIYDELPTG